MATADLSADRLRELLDYNPETGVFTWRVTRSNARAGKAAGNVCKKGLLHIGVDGSMYSAHMLAWLYVHGVMPRQKEIVWLNGATTDNRIANLAPRVKSADRAITYARVMEQLSYDPETGELRWKVPSCNSVKAGNVAGALAPDGYRCIKLGPKIFGAHRLAWFIVHGEWPDGEIDHINGIRDDNRIANLRDISRQGNVHNRRKSWSASGYLGVSRNHGRWRASISVNGRTITIGNFGTPEEAHAAYLEAKRRLHPTFAG